MENVNANFLKEEQHRLLLCYRMARSLGMGEVIIDLTTHKCRWLIMKNDEVKKVCHSLTELEQYLETAFENRYRGLDNYGNMNPALRLRHRSIAERRRSTDTGTPMTFRSRINQPNYYERRKAQKML